MLPSLLWGLCLLVSARAEITVYGQVPIGQIQTLTSTAPGAATTTLAAYNSTILNPPAIPDPPPATNYTLEVQRDAANVNGLSIAHTGASFWGFSIEMSVINQVLGKNSTFIQIPFLNLMQNLVERAGSVYVRLGGNTQEHATMVDYIENYQVITKNKTGLQQTTETPAVLYTIDMFYIMSNISSLANVKWFLGIPFDNTETWRLQIAESAQTILGDNLMGLQAGNEPDYYPNNGHRGEDYTPQNYHDEFASLLTAMDSNANIVNKQMLIAPNLGGGGNGWKPEQVWDTGFLTDFGDRLRFLAVEHYPNNNCFVQFGVGSYVDPQEVFDEYVSHQSGINLASPYLEATALAQTLNKPFIMFETNSASCGGFQGVSDSYGGALWALDYGFQLAYSNFTNGLLHVGGQNVFYNPFTAPPTNQSTYNEWTVGAIFYSTMVIAEAFGKSNTSRIVDLYANGNNMRTPAYAIYENDVLSKFALFNYVDDKTGANDRIVTITIPNASVPSSVRVKYLRSESVAFKNITWAGQTFGSTFESDGRLKGDLDIVTIQCDTANNACQIPLRAPDFALVFLADDEALQLGQATQTYATTARTKTANTVSVDATLLATSNGHSEKDRLNLGSTSSGSVSAAQGSRAYLPSAIAMLSLVIGGAFVMTRNL